MRLPTHSSFCLGTRPLHASRFAWMSSWPAIGAGRIHCTFRCLVPFFPSQALHLLHWLTRHLLRTRRLRSPNFETIYDTLRLAGHVLGRTRMRVAHSSFRLWPRYPVAKAGHHLSSVLFDARWLRDLNRYVYIDVYTYLWGGEMKKKKNCERAISLVETRKREWNDIFDTQK